MPYSQIMLYIAPCMNNTESIDDPEIHQAAGWGIRKKTDPICASEQEIKEWLTIHKKTLRMKSFESKIDFNIFDGPPIIK
jgi:hypothetical protein